MLDPPDPMRAVVADLGISAGVDDQGVLTATHEVVGTPAFRAPESFRGAHQPHSDVYSLGKTLEFLFTRCIPPDLGPGRCLRGPALSDHLWDELDLILERASAYEPGRRYEDAGTLLAALPSVVLVKTDGLPPHTAKGADVSLGWREVQVLGPLIAACPSESDSITSFDLSRRVRVSDYAFAMGFRELRRVGFLDVTTKEDMVEQTWEEFRPTAAAFDWARTHPEEMEPPVDESADEDIPF